MASEEAVVGLREIRDEVLHKVGWNLLIFQEIERMLKFLVAFNGFTLTPSSAANVFAQARAPFDQQTLGQVKGHFVDRVLLGWPPETPPDEGREVRIEMSFRLEADGGGVEKMNGALNALIAERNQLVHHFLPNCDLRSMQSMSDAVVTLDEQRERALDVHRWVKSMIDAIRDHGQEIERFLGSPEGKAEVDLWFLQSSGLVARLLQVAEERQRPDGWTVLDRARALLQAEVAAGLPTLMARYGARSLQELLATSQLFDVMEEPTARGGTRTIYRAKVVEQE